MVIFKINKIIGITAFILLLSPMMLFAQNNSNCTKQTVIDNVKHAVRIMKGIDNDKDCEWAKSQLHIAAEEYANAYSMNVLGMIYMQGLTERADSAKAIYWFEKAGNAGYKGAYHNLGLMFKNGSNCVKQNFEKACHYFRLGAELGSVTCCHAYGFMLYKGLGCKQNYEQAFNMFSKGLDKDYTPALYMAGLCYRNGYGVKKDDNMARAYLYRASLLSYSAATEELIRPDAENCLHDYFASDNPENIPIHMPDIKTAVNDITLLNGVYEGKVITYDWSGKFILNEKPLTLCISTIGKKANGIMYLANDTIPFSASISADGTLLFEDGTFETKDRYIQNKLAKYRIDNAKLDIWDNGIKGSLSFYSLSLKEPDRPMYMMLNKRNVKKNSKFQQISSIAALPSIFSSDFKATFELTESSDARLCIFDKFGTPVYTKELGILNAGKYDITVCPNIDKGFYVLNMVAGKQILRTIIVKK